MTDLKDLPSHELQAELKRRADDAEREHQRKAEERRQLVVKHIDALLELQPEHGRTSCSDENPGNPGRCFRCDLLQIKHEGHWSYPEINIEFRYER